VIVVDQDPEPGVEAPPNSEITLAVGGPNTRLALEILAALQPGFGPSEINEAVISLAKTSPAELVRETAARSRLNPEALRAGVVRAVLCRAVRPGDPELEDVARPNSTRRDVRGFVDRILDLPEARERFPACLTRRQAAAPY
jgi:hypothetical protein